jgi:hypothetical protein
MHFPLSLLLPSLALSALPTVTYRYAATYIAVPGQADPTLVPTKVWERASAPADPAGPALPRLPAISTAQSGFFLFALPLLVLVAAGVVYSHCFWKYETVSNPNYVDPTLFLGTGASALAKARCTIERRRRTDHSDAVE